MSRRAVVLLVAVVGLVAAVPAAAAEAPPASGGQVVEACRAQQDSVPAVPGVVTPGPAACRNVAQLDWGVARACRTAAGAQSDQCKPVDGRDISPADIRAYESSWVHRALTLQRGIDLPAPLYESVLPHTHNSFNSSAYGPTLTNQDPNQVYSITDQLNMDLRLIEMDLHWVPSIYGDQETGGFWVTLCHGTSSNPAGVHIGCTNDRPFQDGLAELKAWLDANPSEFVIVYLENQLSGDAQAHELAATLINDAVGPLVERPATPCAPMDWNRSRASMLAEGHRIAFVGNCDNGAANGWGQTVFERGPKWDESGGPDGYTASSPACAADKAKHDQGVFRRYFEDSTWVAAMVGSNGATSSLGGTTTIDAAQTAAMVGCGVNIIGFDQLTPTDPRLAALVWSWAPDEPRASAGGCAVQGSDGRFRAAPCEQPKNVACVDDTSSWHVTAAAVPFDQGWQACQSEFPGSRFAVPVNGYRNGQLKDAKGTTADVLVNYRVSGSDWTANALPAALPEPLAQFRQHGQSVSVDGAGRAQSRAGESLSATRASSRGESGSAATVLAAITLAALVSFGIASAGRKRPWRERSGT